MSWPKTAALKAKNICQDAHISCPNLFSLYVHILSVAVGGSFINKITVVSISLLDRCQIIVLHRASPILRIQISNKSREKYKFQFVYIHVKQSVLNGHIFSKIKKTLREKLFFTLVDISLLIGTDCRREVGLDVNNLKLNARCNLNMYNIATGVHIIFCRRFV